MCAEVRGTPVKMGTEVGKEPVHAVERTGRVTRKAVVEAALKAAGSTAAKAVGCAMRRKEGSSNAQRISLHVHVAVIGGDPWTRSGACLKDRSHPT